MILVAVGAAAAGFVQGLTGFAFGLVALAFWIWALPPEIAGPLVVACSLLGQLLNGRTTLRGFRMPAAWPFIAGGVLGVPLGAWLLPLLDPMQFRFWLGAFLIVWCPAMLRAAALPRITFGGRVADAVAGWIGGVMGGLGGLSGPAPTLWVTLRRWDKDSQRAVFQAFHTTMHSLALAAYLAGGLITMQGVWMFAVAAPCMLVPALLGACLYARIDDQMFRRLVLGLLFASGVVLVASGWRSQL